MADEETVPEEGFDKDGNPIIPKDEGGGAPPETTPKEGEGELDDKDEDIIGDIPVRNSALQHIINRKNKTIEKLRSRDEEDEDDDKGIDDDLTPEARTAVQREVANAIAPVMQNIVSKADEDELVSLLSNEPEAKKYEKRIRAYMGHKEYKGVPPSVIFHHLAFSTAAATGARRRSAADLDANQNKAGGRSSKATPSETGNVPSIDEQNEMSDADFETLQNRARSGEFSE